jgi:hypothetical protein
LEQLQVTGSYQDQIIISVVVVVVERKEVTQQELVDLAVVVMAVTVELFHKIQQQAQLILVAELVAAAAVHKP